MADGLFKDGNYVLAIPEYKKLLKFNREHAGWNFNLALCYLNSNVGRKNAKFYLERASKQTKFDKELYYYLGVACMLNYEWDEAKSALEKYIALPGKNLEIAQKALKDCITAEELMIAPVHVKFDNMGDLINSEFPDYYPFISGDEKQLAFTTRRKEKGAVLEFDGYYTSDIYFSKFDGADFSKAKDAGKINTKYNEQCTGFTPDGETMLMYSDYLPAGELFLVNKEANQFNKKKKIDEIDELKVLESSAIISPDRNTIIYSSKRDGGLGGLDLWMIRKLPDGTWGLPQNLGPNVNSNGDEDFPSFSPEGTKVFFSSNGHPGMGGYDVYAVDWDPDNNQWGTVQNIGYPVNTPDHERSISFTSDMKHAYMALDREDSKGDLDIYRLTFQQVEVKPALLKIKVQTIINSEKVFVQADSFTIYDMQESLIGDYRPNTETNEYTVNLSPGVYNMIIKYDDTLREEVLIVNEFMNRMGIISKIVNIEPKSQ